MTTKFENGLFIFRRDLRIVDNNGLNLLNEKCKNIYAIFIFTPEQVGSGNKYKSDNSVQFMISSLQDLSSQISKSGGHLYTFYGHNDKVVADCIKAWDIDVVCFNLDITKYARERDAQIIKLCESTKTYVMYDFDYYLCEPGTIVIGEDMRPSSPTLATAFSAGVTSQGLDVIRIGLASTDMLYFASGKLNLPGAMFTASHNPAAYNGIKLCLSGARPIGKESGLVTIENFVKEGTPMAMRNVGVEKEQNMLEEYVDHLLTLVDVSSIRPLKVVIDAGNGMGGYTAPAVFKRLNAEVIEMYFELDGTFPNHEANPIEPSNLVDLQKAVKKHKADIGLAFDGDADRCFVVDETGAVVSPSIVCAIVAEREIARARAAGETEISVIHNLLTSRIVEQTIRAGGATPIRTKVGHSLIKSEMARTNAVFGGEHSAH